jgi:hypothetical protein
MRHISVEDLISYADEQNPVSDRPMIETHLLSCVDCREVNEEIRSFVSALCNDSAFEPPAELLQWGINLFQPLVQPSPVGLRKVIASLIYDSFDQPLLAGVRSVGAPPRQMLYRAGDVDVDVKIESMHSYDRISLAGQVLSSAPKFYHNTPVKLVCHGLVRYETTTNVVGEFSFDEVPKDTYHLWVDLPERELKLFCVNRGNS